MQIELPNQDFATVHLHDDFDHYLVSQGARDIDVQVYHDHYPPCLLAAKVYNGQGIRLNTIAQMGLSATPPALTGQEPAALAAFVYAHFDEIYRLTWLIQTNFKSFLLYCIFGWYDF